MLLHPNPKRRKVPRSIAASSERSWMPTLASSFRTALRCGQCARQYAASGQHQPPGSIGAVLNGPCLSWDSDVRPLCAWHICAAVRSYKFLLVPLSRVHNPCPSRVRLRQPWVEWKRSVQVRTWGTNGKKSSSSYQPPHQRYLTKKTLCRIKGNGCAATIPCSYSIRSDVLCASESMRSAAVRRGASARTKLYFLGIWLNRGWSGNAVLPAAFSSHNTYWRKRGRKLAGALCAGRPGAHRSCQPCRRSSYFLGSIASGVRTRSPTYAPRGWSPVSTFTMTRARRA